MRIVVTGVSGQVATALSELGASGRAEVILVGRPALDLARPATVQDALKGLRADVIVNAAAYTAVDKAESDAAMAFAVNATGAGAVAQAARDLAVPIVHLSTDYVFDGEKKEAYVEGDPVGPTGVYGASKLAGEQAVANGNPLHVILRTAWVYSATGANFVKTMLRLAHSKAELGVVHDQVGNPTAAPDIAEAIFAISNALTRKGSPERFGVFHLSGQGQASWAEFAEAIFDDAKRRGAPHAAVKPIATSEFPTAARRPANSRLNCDKARRVYGVALPHWRTSLGQCLDRLIA
jgi:dTDP-4-dehydrorhamnose reductase